MPTNYKVEQGDYLSRIARKYGFADYNVIWNDPRNAQLKQKRKSPNVLFPGDVLIIPDKASKQVDRAISQSHVFVVPSATVLLLIVLKDLDFKPLSDIDCALNFNNKTTPATADASGLVQATVDVTKSHAGTLVLRNPEQAINVRAGILVGNLNPVTMPSGQMARLNNLGYFGGKLAAGDALDQKKDIDPKEMIRFKSAVEEFQCDHMGPGSVDGVCGPHTQSKLKEVYGC
jgi:LysM repeat protein